MSTEDESWREKFSNNEGGGRDGYRASSNNGEGNRNARPAGSGRPMRPRITRSVYSSSDYRDNRNSGNYGTPRQPREGGYRPRPMQGAGREEGYTPRPSSYGPGREEGYQPRQSYNPNREGGQRPQANRPRPAYGQGAPAPARDGNYRQRPAAGREGGFQQGGPRPRRQRTADYNPHAKYSMKKQIEYKETHIDPDEPIRLNRFLANAGVCSRREADTYIQAGVVSVNGTVVTELGTKVKRSDHVMFHDQAVNIEKKVYILLNKPKDYVTTSEDPQNRKTVMDLIKGACRERVYPVGRLDRNTTGVLLLTNDGELASKLTHPQYLKKKIYHVHCDKAVTAADIKLIADGIQLEDGEIHADAIEYASPTDKKQVGIEIHSGRNRIVRRIFESLGYRVVKLDRVFFAGLTKKNVRRGDWRFLTEKEVNMLRMGAFE
ncbi:MAG: pseudouridine synthase [Bacteroidaceae bacterium]